jgi:hypothetical protein
MAGLIEFVVAYALKLLKSQSLQTAVLRGSTRRLIVSRSETERRPPE